VRSEPSTSSRGERSYTWAEKACVIALLACGSLSPGCTAGEPTEIMVTVQTDLSPGEATHFLIRVMHSVGETRHPDHPPHTEECGAPPPRPETSREYVAIGGRGFEVRQWMLIPYDTATRFPLTIGVAPKDRDASRVGQFEVYALRCPAGTDDCADGEVLAWTAARTSFVKGRLVRLLLYVTARCVGVCCDGDRTCRDGACAPVEVDPACLSSGDDDPATMMGLSCDGGSTADAGLRLDAGPGVDAGPAGTDGGPSDAGMECMPGATETQQRDCECGGHEERSRSCGPGGTWTDWSGFGACRGAGGDCSPPGSEGFRGGGFRCPGDTCETVECWRVCQSNCTWSGYGGNCEFCTGSEPPHCVDELTGTKKCEGEQVYREGPTPGCWQSCRCRGGIFSSCMSVGCM